MYCVHDKHKSGMILDARLSCVEGGSFDIMQLSREYLSVFGHETCILVVSSDPQRHLCTS